MNTVLEIAKFLGIVFLAVTILGALTDLRTCFKAKHCWTRLRFHKWDYLWHKRYEDSLLATKECTRCKWVRITYYPPFIEDAVPDHGKRPRKK